MGYLEELHQFDGPELQTVIGEVQKEFGVPMD